MSSCPSTPGYAELSQAGSTDLASPSKSASQLLVQELESFRHLQSGQDLVWGYALGEQIASGAEGDVYCAASSIGGGVAIAVKRIKLISPSSLKHAVQEIGTGFYVRERFCEEAGQMAAAASHPNVVAYLDWFAGPSGLDRELCIVMERSNLTLSDCLYMGSRARIQYDRHCADQAASRKSAACSSRRHTGSSLGVATSAVSSSSSAPAPSSTDPLAFRFPEWELANFLHQLLSALAFLNRHGVVHRDIKTENILWHDASPVGTYKLADFGSAVRLQEGAVCKAEDAGTLWTMAPELLGKRTHGPSCDTWSLGCVLFEVASFNKPFPAKDLLGFRSSGEASLEGSFWPAMCNQVLSSGPLPVFSAPGSRPLASPARCSTASPPLGRRSSRPSSVRPAAVAQSGRMLLESASASSLSSASRAPRAYKGSGGVALFPSEPSSPASPTPTAWADGSAAAAAGSRSTFLRKRLGFRWCYSDELRALIYEDMLEEDGSCRPLAANLLASERLERLLLRHGWCRPDAESSDAFLPPTVNPVVVPELSSSQDPALHMRQLTPKTFLAAAKAGSRSSASEPDANGEG